MYRNFIFALIAVFILGVVGVGIIVMISTDADKATVWMSMFTCVLVMVMSIIQLYMFFQIKKKIKNGLDRVSLLLQSEKMNLYLRLKEDFCLVKSCARIFYRYNFV